MNICILVGNTPRYTEKKHKKLLLVLNHKDSKKVETWKHETSTGNETRRSYTRGEEWLTTLHKILRIKYRIKYGI